MTMVLLPSTLLSMLKWKTTIIDSRVEGTTIYATTVPQISYLEIKAN